MRHQPVDILRGVALVAMIVYHAAWFSVDAGLTGFDMRALGWVVFQKCIAGSFFGLVGLSLHLATMPTFHRLRHQSFLHVRLATDIIESLYVAVRERDWFCCL